MKDLKEFLVEDDSNAYEDALKTYNATGICIILNRNNLKK